MNRKLHQKNLAMNKTESILSNLIDNGKGWETLSPSEWIDLVCDNSEYVAKCDAAKGWYLFDVSDWMRLLKSRPTYAEKCDEVNGWDKFNVDDVIDFLKENPKLKNIFPRHFWNKFNDNAIDWIRLLDEIPSLVTQCDWVNGWKHFATAWRYDEYGYQVEENKWPDFLGKHPEFAYRCNKVNGWKDFEIHDWVKLLKQQPQFAIRFNVYKRWQDLNGFDWVELLRDQPIFAEKCDKYDGWLKIDFSALEGTCKASLGEWNQECITVHGKIVDTTGNQIEISKIRQIKCDYTKCGHSYEYIYWGNDGKEVLRTKAYPPFCGRWAELLEKQPKFSAKCEEFNGWESFDGFDWFRLLFAQPRFAIKCDELDGWDKLFGFRPEKYSHTEEEEGGYSSWNEYVHEPIFVIPDEYVEVFSREYFLSAEEGSGGLPVYYWLYRAEGGRGDIGFYVNGDLCFHVNESISKNEPNILKEDEITTLLRKLDKRFWIYFLYQFSPAALRKAVQYGMEHIWTALTIDDWKLAIRNKTAFINRNAVFDRKDWSDYNPFEEFFDDNFWNALTAAWPDFLDNLAYWRKDSHGDYYCEVCEVWAYLLRHRPDWAVHMSKDDWTRFEEKDWTMLLHPHWQYLSKITVPIDDWFWWNCLSKAPQFADLCEQHDGLATLSNNQLCDLMTKHIELTRYCVKYLQYENMLYENWITLLSHPKECEYFMLKCDKYNGWTKFSMRNGHLGWAKLLSVCPQLKNKCTALNGWSKFNGSDWQILLSAQPQFANFCEDNKGWEMFDYDDWMYLINYQPSFSGKYNERRVNYSVRSKQTDAEIIKEAKAFVSRRQNADYEDWGYDDRASPEELGQLYPNEGY